MGHSGGGVAHVDDLKVENERCKVWIDSQTTTYRCTVQTECTARERANNCCAREQGGIVKWVRQTMSTRYCATLATISCCHTHTARNIRGGQARGQTERWSARDRAQASLWRRQISSHSKGREASGHCVTRRGVTRKGGNGT